jgi:DNA-binding MarR family transcriptional regulator
VKKLDSNKSATIRHESELVHHFRELLPGDPDLVWHCPPDSNSELPSRVELEFDGRQLPFAPLYELKASLPWVENLPTDQLPQPLLVTPELSPRVLAACKARGISAIDLNGRAWLRASGLLVDRRPLPGRSFSYELEPRNIFVGKSARIIRCLLTDRERVWTQSEIVTRTGASSGLVSRIVQHLISQGFAEKISPREFRLRDSLSLLDAWSDADQFSKRNRTTLYAGFLGSPIELARRLQEWARDESVSIAFTQWLAAWLRHPFTEPVVTSAYISRLPDSATLEKLGLRPVSEGGKLWLHVPDDEGLLRESQIHDGLTLATDAQIYLDLQRTGLRGPDAATALREWKGFCRP